MGSESAHNIWYGVSCSQDPLVQESRAKTGMFLLNIMTSNTFRLEKFELPICAPINSDGLEVLGPKGKGSCQETQQIFY